MTQSGLHRTVSVAAALVVSTSAVLAASAQAALPERHEQLANAAAQPTSVDWSVVEQALGRTGTMMPGGVLRIGIPRSDLAVTVEGVPDQAGFALGSNAAFRPMDDGSVMVMGDLVLLDEEVPGVMAGLFGRGFQVTALHNHLNQVTPHVMYLHYEGMGDAVQLATGLHDALGSSNTPLGPNPPASPPPWQLDADALQGIIGHNGQVNNGVLAIGVPRAETVTEHGVEILPSMGVTTALNFQPTEGVRAAVTGDFALTGDEVNPVASTLHSAGVKVTAIHQHHIGEEPRLFYMHFWANDEPVKLATALRAALDLTNSAPPVVVAATQ